VVECDSAKNPYASGFGLRSAKSRGFAPITPRPRPEPYGFFHWPHEKPVRKQEGNSRGRGRRISSCGAREDTCHTRTNWSRPAFREWLLDTTPCISEVWMSYRNASFVVGLFKKKIDIVKKDRLS
jgi:hypothetical protein